MNLEIITERLDRLGGIGRRSSASGGRSDFDLNPDGRPGYARERDLTAASVLVPLVNRPEGIAILLTQRTDHLSDHAGQISFPGGRAEAEDDHPEATALREAEEEVGLPAEHVRIIGRLDIYETSTAYEVTPVVGWIEPPFPLKLDPFEVAEAFEVPLSFILDPANHRRESRLRNGQQRHFYVLPYGDRYIWGATAGMLINLFEVLRN